MKTLKFNYHSFFITLLISSLFVGCSSIHKIEKHDQLSNSINEQKNEDELLMDRNPASNDCSSLISRFFKKNDLGTQKDALKKKSLLTLREGFWVSPKPKLEKLAELKKSLALSFKNWHGHKYPTYFLLNEPDVKLITENYSKTLIKSLNQVDQLTDEDKALLEIVNGWISKFESYPVELDNMLEERISLQYNLNFLKNFELNKEREVVKLNFKKEGKDIEKTFIFYKKDKNLDFEIKNLKKELKAFDETLEKEGKLKDRVIRQAALKEMIQFVQRDIEVAGFNIADAKLAHELKTLSKDLNQLLNKSQLQTTSYGVYKLNSDIFWNEILPINQVQTLKEYFKKTGSFFGHAYGFTKEKLKASINFAKEAPRKLIDGVKDLFKKDVDEKGEKIGFFKKLYAKIKAIDPKKAAIGAGVVGVGFIGAEQYFGLEPNTTIDCVDLDSGEKLECSDASERLENTQKQAELINQNITEQIDAASADLF